MSGDKVAVFVAAEADEGTAMGVYPSQLAAVVGMLTEFESYRDDPETGMGRDRHHTWEIEVLGDNQVDMDCKGVDGGYLAQYRIMRMQVTPALFQPAKSARSDR